MFTYMPDDRGIAFDVNETFHINSGQGISEMLSISLDPDILVQPHSDYAQVRGLLILNGEFKKCTNNHGHQPTNQQMNQIEKIDDVNDQIAKFYHRIPVEVAIPLHRINDINDIKAVVESFDYELTNEYSLKINASLHILGMNQSKDEMGSNDSKFVIHNNSEQEQNSKEFNEGKEPPHVDDENTSLEKKTTSDSEEKSNMVEHPHISEQDNKQVLSKEEDDKIDVQLVEQEHDDGATDAETTDVMFLTEFLSEENEESQMKLTIHITQEDDTIESIASRYDIPTTKLMQENNLTTQPLEEGKLLTIQESRKQ